jgi:hypothetical protein
MAIRIPPSADPCLGDWSAPMPSRFSLDRSLKAVVLAFSAGLIALTSMNLQASWQAKQRSERARTVVDASRQIFTAMANMRTERSSIQRSWELDGGLTPATKEALERYLGAELPALDKASALLDGIDFAGKDRLLPDAHAAMDRLAAMRQSTIASRAWARTTPTRASSCRASWRKSAPTCSRG